MIPTSNTRNTSQYEIECAESYRQLDRVASMKMSFARGCNNIMAQHTSYNISLILLSCRNSLGHCASSIPETSST